jgi:hypothetical protein
LFVKGPRGDHYLSQTAAGQSRTSPCVDAGSDYATSVGMWHYTTRTDEASDAGIVDMGYHHPVTHPCRLCDLAFDGVIEFSDYARVAEAWLEESCSKQDAWCQGADLTSDTRVDFRDILFLADCWLVFDATPPIPDPSRWETEPYLSSGSSITMKAETAFDAWGWDVEYYFDCIDDAGCHDSGWITDPNFTDVNLAPDMEYGYRVRARDRSTARNTTPWSDTVLLTTPGLADTIPPDPDPAEWDPAVDANGYDGYPQEIPGSGIFDYSARMRAVVAVDAGGGPVEYFFQCTTESGFSSGWIATEAYRVLVGRTGQGHRFRVKARDQWGNETAWSTIEVTRQAVNF